jgi:hypothetical protein
MKKLIMTAAVVACAASMVSAQVYSQNIVGYSKTDIGAGAIDIVALQFSGMDAGVTLSNAFSGLTANESVLYRFNGVSYDVYNYYGANGWYKGATPSDDVVIDKGEEGWLKGGSAADTALQAGEVPSAASLTNTVSAGIGLVANPYPVETRLGDLAGTALVSNDTIVYVFNGVSYDVYNYYGVNGWYKGATLSDDVKIAVGQGFWFKSTAGGNLVFNKGF